MLDQASMEADETRKTIVIGAGLSGVWLLLIVIFWLFAPDNPEGGASTVTRIAAFIGAILPFAMIWMAIFLANRVRDLHGEAEELRARLRMLQDQSSARTQPTVPAEHGSRPAQPATSVQPKPAATKAAPAKQNVPQQTAMSFDPPDSVDLSAETLIRALNFPDDANDHAAITAMRTALQDHELARVIRAAQDVITMLAEHEITMDGISPDTASVAIWRRFAGGERGAAVQAIGSTQSNLALEIVTTLLRSDEIFRDSAHHFLRHFDHSLARSAAKLDDAELEALVDTRSARAFILLGRASGSFGQ